MGLLVVLSGLYLGGGEEAGIFPLVVPPVRFPFVYPMVTTSFPNTVNQSLSRRSEARDEQLNSPFPPHRGIAPSPPTDFIPSYIQNLVHTTAS